MKTTVNDRQTLLDLALATGGTLEVALELARTNALSLTDRLADGQLLEVPEPTASANRRTVELYAAHSVAPATEPDTAEIAACPYGGIGLMGVEIDFEVS